MKKSGKLILVLICLVNIVLMNNSKCNLCGKVLPPLSECNCNDDISVCQDRGPGY